MTTLTDFVESRAALAQLGASSCAGPGSTIDSELRFVDYAPSEFIDQPAGVAVEYESADGGLERLIIGVDAGALVNIGVLEIDAFTEDEEVLIDDEIPDDEDPDMDVFRAGRAMTLLMAVTATTKSMATTTMTRCGDSAVKITCPVAMAAISCMAGTAAMNCMGTKALTSCLVANLTTKCTAMTAKTACMAALAKT